MKKTISIFLAVIMILASSISSVTADDVRYTVIKSAESKTALDYLWDISELSDSSTYTGDTKISGWYSTAPQDGGTQIVHTFTDDGRLCYDATVNNGIAESKNVEYTLALTSEYGDLVSDMGDGKYTWVVPVRVDNSNTGIPFGNGFEFCLYDGNITKVFGVGYKGGITDGANKWHRNNGFLKGNTDYVFNFIIDNSGEATAVTFYSNDTLIGTYTLSRKLEKVANLRLRLRPIQGGSWHDINYKFGNISFFEGDGTEMPRAKLDVQNDMLVVSGDANTEYTVKILNPASDDDGIAPFEASFTSEQYELATEEEKVRMLHSSNTVTTDETGKAYVECNFTAPGRYCAFGDGVSNPMEIFVGTEGLIANMESYYDSKAFELVFRSAAKIPKEETAHLLEAYADLEDKASVVVLSDSEFSYLRAAILWQTIAHSELIDNSDVENLKNELESLGYADDKAFELFALCENRAAVVAMAQPDSLNELIAELKASAILIGVSESEYAFDAGKFLAEAQSERYNEASDTDKLRLAAGVMGNTYAGLEELCDAIDKIDLPEIIVDTSENCLVRSEQKSEWSVVWESKNYSGYYSGTSDDTSLFPVNEYKDDSMVYSADEMNGQNYPANMFYTYNMSNEDSLVPLVDAQTASEGEFTVSFDMAINNAYGNGFVITLRYLATAGTFRAVNAFSVNYDGVVLNSSSSWLTARKYIEIGKTYHYALVVNRNEGTIDIYVDGAYLGTSAYTDGASDAANSLYAINFRYNPYLNSLWTNTAYMMNNIRIDEGKHTEPGELRLYIENGEVTALSEPERELVLRIYKPKNTTPFVDSFADIFTKKEYDAYSDAGASTELIAFDDIVAYTDSEGKYTFELPTMDAGLYSFAVKKSDGEEWVMQYAFNKLEKLLEIEPIANIKDDSFANLYDEATGKGADAGDEITQIVRSLKNPGEVITLCEAEMENLYAAALWQEAMENDEADAELLEKLSYAVDELKLDTYPIELLESNNKYTEVTKHLVETDAETLEDVLEILKEKAILEGIKNVVIASEAEIFVKAAGSRKYENASKSQKAQILSEVKGEEFESVEALLDAIDDIKFKSESSGGSGSGSGSHKPTGGFTADDAPTVVKPDTSTGSDISGFADVPSSHWAYDSITEMAQKGIINGFDGYFRPSDSITRAEYVKILCGIFGIGQQSGSYFDDVSHDVWYAGYVNGAYLSGLVLGGDSGFMPDAFITRQDAAVMLYRFALNAGKNSKSDAELLFTDADSISDYAREAVASLSNSKIINGYSDGSFAPLASITRAEAAKMTAGYLN